MENFIELWTGLVRAPEATLKAKKGSLSDAAIVCLVISLINAVLFGLAAVVLLGISHGAEGLAAGTFGAVLVGVIIVVGGVIYVFVMSAIYYVFAKLLGGKGTYPENAYAYSLVYSLSPVLFAINLAFSLIPYLGSLVSLAVSLYMLYIYAIAIKTANSLSTGRAVAVVVIPIIVLFLIIIVMIVPLLAALLYLGIFNVQPPEVCMFGPGISCESFYLNAGDGKLNLTFMNGLQKEITVTGVACSGQTGNPTYTDIPDATAGTGGELSISGIQCYDASGATLNPAAGEVYNGKLLVRYYFESEGPSATRMISGTISVKAS
ncbi:MAG: Yip1 family protein [Candidatus Micrarchaeota archaeon]|nr:Yip1 family protein [Candidatus Micrarchaeota archaeon]